MHISDIVRSYHSLLFLFKHAFTLILHYSKIFLLLISYLIFSLQFAAENTKFIVMLIQDTLQLQKQNMLNLSKHHHRKSNKITRLTSQKLSRHCWPIVPCQIVFSTDCWQYVEQQLCNTNSKQQTMYNRMIPPLISSLFAREH